ncbi:MFS transporter [Lysinibacillus sp. 54212]|uniref:MFS transporter n=1 Tax=Lysinibacillus sp. 54212 TaxID=3119829 RepID=UPI002FC5F6B0
MQHFTKVVWMQGLIDFSLSAYFIFVSWFLYAETESAIYAGLFVSLGFLPSFICNLYFGAVVDRSNKKRVIQYALVIIVIVLTTVFFMFKMLIPVVLIITHMVIQLCGSLIRPAIQAYLTVIFSKEQLLSIFSKSASYTIIGGILGTSISSLFIAKSNIILLSLSILIPLFISLFLFSLLPEEKSENHFENDSIIKEIIAGFSYLLVNKYFLQLLALMAIGQLTYHTTIGFLAAYTFGTLQSSVTIYGTLEIIVSIGGILAGMISVKLVKLLNFHFPTAAYSLLTLSLTIFTFSPSIALSALGCFGIGFCTTWIRTNFQAIQQMSTKDQFHGRVASIRMFFNQGFVVCLTPLFGILAQKSGIEIIFATLACISFIGTFICFFLSRNNDFKNVFMQFR